MTDNQLHEAAVIADKLGLRPYDRRAAVDRMIADGRAERVNVREWRLTQAGVDWIARVG